MSESDIQRQIIIWLKSQGFKCWKVPLGPNITGSRSIRCKNPMAGHPDIAGVLEGGRYFVIEVKTATGKVSPIQRQWLNELNHVGALTCVARCLEDVKKAFGS